MADHTEFLTPEAQAVIEAALALREKMRTLEPHLTSVFGLAAIHGAPWRSGPEWTWAHEAHALDMAEAAYRAALIEPESIQNRDSEETRQPSPASGDGTRLDRATSGSSPAAGDPAHCEWCGGFTDERGQALPIQPPRDLALCGCAECLEELDILRRDAAEVLPLRTNALTPEEARALCRVIFGPLRVELLTFAARDTEKRALAKLRRIAAGGSE